MSDGGYTAVAEQLGIKRETLRRWVIEEEVEGGTRPGVSRDERSRVAELERENRELRVRMFTDPRNPNRGPHLRRRSGPREFRTAMKYDGVRPGTIVTLVEG